MLPFGINQQPLFGSDRAPVHGSDMQFDGGLRHNLNREIFVSQ